MASIFIVALSQRQNRERLRWLGHNHYLSGCLPEVTQHFIPHLAEADRPWGGHSRFPQRPPSDRVGLSAFPSDTEILPIRNFNLAECRFKPGRASLDSLVEIVVTHRIRNSGGAADRRINKAGLESIVRERVP